MKVSTNLFFDRASNQLGTVQSSLSKTQEQLSTGKQITKPSDEPDKASLVTRLESELARQKKLPRHAGFGGNQIEQPGNGLAQRQRCHVPHQRTDGAGQQ